jgi:hypothetical protein
MDGSHGTALESYSRMIDNAPMDSVKGIRRLHTVDIPGFALFPRGGFCSTTYYYRNLGGVSLNDG